MSPGPELDEMNQKSMPFSIQMICTKMRIVLDTLVPTLENITPPGSGTDLRFFELIKEIITLVSTDAFYGKDNPFKDPEVAAGFW